MPLVGITANRLIDDGVHREWIRRRYIDALECHAKVQVVVVPTSSRENMEGISQIVSRLDGLVLTGDESNIDTDFFIRSNTSMPAPSEASYLQAQRDPFRDVLASCLLGEALHKRLPIFGICRGLQELNVFLGGKLHSDLSKIQTMLCHKEDVSLPRDRQYEPAHSVLVQSGGVLSRILGNSAPIFVNSLHTQGIQALAPGLASEAVAPDGLIEAASVTNAGTFQLGVQWHPEWHVDEDATSRKLFAEFGRACSAFELSRLAAGHNE